MATAQWTQEAQLTASDGAAGDRLGESVALSGNTLICGAGFADPGGFFNAGAVYVYEYDGAAWNETAKLILDELVSEDFIGRSVALEGDLAVAAGFRQAAGGFAPNALVVFRRSAGVWTIDSRIAPPDDTIALGGKFGSSIDLSGSSIVIGAKRDNGGGTAYVFTLALGVWTYEGELAHGSVINSRFGQSVSISGDTLVVGAPNDGAGSAWVYDRTGSSWSLTQKLTKPGGSSGEQFGVAVDIDGDTIVVGANFDNTSVGPDAGSATVFRFDGTGWNLESGLVPGGQAAGDNFGKAVSVHGDTAVVGAWRDTLAGSASGSVNGEGSAFVFTRTGTVWTQEQKLTAQPSGSGDKFAFSVDLEGELVVIGAPRQGSTDEGAAYAFRRGGPAACTSCATHCGAGLTAEGCNPLLSAWGEPRGSAAVDFSLFAYGLEPGLGALFAVGTGGRAATPFGSGSSLLCVAPPLFQGGLTKVGGSGRCAGTLRADLDAVLAPLGGVQATQPGTTLQAQVWTYSPVSGGVAVRSDAVELTIQP